MKIEGIAFCDTMLYIYFLQNLTVAVPPPLPKDHQVGEIVKALFHILESRQRVTS